MIFCESWDSKDSRRFAANFTIFEFWCSANWKMFVDLLRIRWFLKIPVDCLRIRTFSEIPTSLANSKTIWRFATIVCDFEEFRRLFANSISFKDSNVYMRIRKCARTLEGFNGFWTIFVEFETNRNSAGGTPARTPPATTDRRRTDGLGIFFGLCS